MSEFPEGRLGGRMDDGFDLPRYATRDDPSMHSGTHYLYSSAASSPHAATHDHNAFVSNPPSNTVHGQSRQNSRYSQVMEGEHSGSSMARSASLNNANRSRPSHQTTMADDRERVYVTEGQSPGNSQRHLANSFYPAALGFGSAEPAAIPSQQQQDYLSFTPENPVRRSNTQTDATMGARKNTSTYPIPTAPATYNDPYAGSYPVKAEPLDVPLSSVHHSKGPPSPLSINYTPQTAAQIPQSQRSPHAEAQLSHAASNFSTLTSGTPISLDPSQSSSRQYYPTPSQIAVSAPGTPISQGGSRQSSHLPQQQQAYQIQDYGQQIPAIKAEPSPQQRRVGFKRVRDARDLRPMTNSQPTNRRVDASGVFVSPLKALTTHISQTYNLCNPQFRYEMAHNPRRVLTKPSKPAHNDGYDNEDYDYILYVNDWLGAEEGHNKYLILDILGQGTFGQVVKCQNMKTHEIVAVKVVKNKPAYFSQSMMEVTILELLNTTWDPHDEHHILRLRDTFIHRKHLCLVFELLSSNLYELIKQNQFSGLSTQLVRVFTAQLLDSLTVLNEARLIHCDLKPENILLKTLQAPQIKVIDFGSACHERQTVYTYIQSRFYRSPEVLLGMPYTSAIDMWSLGCIAVELFLGLPLFPGTSEYNQITRIVEMLGLPPTYALEMGKQATQFFATYVDEYGRKQYRLKPIDLYSREHGTQEQPGKKYFAHNTLPEIIRAAPMPKASSKPGDLEKEMANRTAFIDFVQGLLNLNPIERWSPQQAKLHPFITGEKFLGPYVPSGAKTQRSNTQPAAGTTGDPKRPYGGLVPSQPKGTRAYTDAASYNQHLAQHQAYTAQAATQQAVSNAMRNPYSSYSRDDNPEYSSQMTGQQQQQQQPRLQHQVSASALAPAGSYAAQPPNPLRAIPSNNPNPPSVSYYPASRTRANTINQMDVVPPQIARIANMGVDAASISRNTLTPVLNREDAIREWERRQSGKQTSTHTTYPQLEFLQQQAELGPPSWSNASTSARYAIPPPPPAANMNFHPLSSSIVAGSQDRSNGLRDVTMSASNARLGSGGYDPNTLSSPPQAYSGGPTSAQRYAANYQQPTTRQYESLEQYSSQPHGPQSYATGQGQQLQQSQQPRYAATNHVSPQAPQSFYNAGVMSASTAAAARNPFSANSPSQAQPKDARRANDMDIWPR